MRLMIVLAAVGLAAATLSSRVTDRSAFTARDAKPAPVATAAPSPSGQKGPRRMLIGQDRTGHFRVSAQVDGRPVNFVVDTGATSVALNERDAKRLGLSVDKLPYTAMVSTANGVTQAAVARLGTVNIGGVVVNNVEALVIRGSGLTENLLGMTFLSRLNRYEVSGGTLVMEQ